MTCRHTISCHDMMSYDIMAPHLSWHLIMTWCPVVTLSHVMTGHHAMTWRHVVTTDIISQHNIISWHHTMSWHGTWYHLMTWYHVTAWYHVITLYHVTTWYHIITCCRVIKWYNVMTSFHVNTWYPKNPVPWFGSLSDFMSSYFGHLKLHPWSTILNYLSALKLFYLNGFDGFYRFSQMLGGWKMLFGLSSRGMNIETCLCTGNLWKCLV